MTKDFTTRNTRGAQRMANNGQKVPFWMGCYSGLDNLGFATAQRAYQNKLKAFLQGFSGTRPVYPASA